MRGGPRLGVLSRSPAFAALAGAPVVGGLVVYLGGVRAGLAGDALTFLVSVPLLSRVPRLPPAPRETVTGIWADATAGVRYILRAPAIRGLTIGFFLVGLSAGDDVALPFLAPVLGAGVRGTGALFAAVGAGLILGYLLLARRSGSAWATRGLLIGGTLAALGNTLTGLAPLMIAAVAFQMVRGVGLALDENALQTALQRTVPREMLGRVSSNAYGAVNVGACLGLVIAGPLLDATSARTVLVACGAIGVVGAVVTA